MSGSSSTTAGRLVRPRRVSGIDPDGSRQFRTVPDGSGWFQTVPDGSRRFRRCRSGWVGAARPPRRRRGDAGGGGPRRARRAGRAGGPDPPGRPATSPVSRVSTYPVGQTWDTNPLVNSRYTCTTLVCIGAPVATSVPVLYKYGCRRSAVRPSILDSGPKANVGLTAIGKSARPFSKTVMIAPRNETLASFASLSPFLAENT